MKISIDRMIFEEFLLARIGWLRASVNVSPECERVKELKKQLDLNESMPQIQGTILFRENYLNQPQTQQAVNYLKSRWGG